MNSPDRKTFGVSYGAGRGHFTLPITLLFAGSGCAALVYQLVWFHLLRMAIGASAVSLGILLSSFMGGMCLGSWLYSRVVAMHRHPLRVYGIVEILIGIMGLVLVVGLPHVGKLYLEHGSSGNILLRAVVSGISLLPPTILMGATLPAIARWVQNTPEGMGRLGYFYGANIVGAVAGCVLAGFFLLRFYDVKVGTYVAAGLNFAVGIVALLLARSGDVVDEGEEEEKKRIEQAGASVGGEFGGGSWLAYVVTGISGFTALAAEVVWTRVLAMSFGATVYAFAIILAVFLAGLGIGSSCGAGWVRRARNPWIGLGWCQAGLVLSISLAAFYLQNIVPYWKPVEWQSSGAPVLLSFANDSVRTMMAILLPAFFWGASFPVALAAAGRRERDPGKTVGGIYAANTVGAILGALSFTFFVVPEMGLGGAQILMAVLAAVAAVASFVWALRGQNGSRGRIIQHGLVGSLLVVACLVAWSLPGRTIARAVGQWAGFRVPLKAHSFVFYEEGMTSTVGVTEQGSLRMLHVSGKVVASTWKEDMRVQRMLGHFPALFHPNPRSVLIVGLGTGTTAGSFVDHPGVERIVICEIEPRVAEAAAGYFGEENRHVLSDPRTEVVFDDGRHYLATTQEKFDVITSDPIHPWIRGAAALYSADYYEVVKTRLNPGGIVAQWVPLYLTNIEAVKSELATFFHKFPNGTFWKNSIAGKGYDAMMLAKMGPWDLNPEALDARIAAMEAVQKSLEEVDLGSADKILQVYSARAEDLRDWLSDAELNRDSSLRLEYLAGLPVKANDPDAIYRAIAPYEGSPEWMLGKERNAESD